MNPVRFCPHGSFVKGANFHKLCCLSFSQLFLSMPLFSKGHVIVFWNLEKSCLYVKSGFLQNEQFQKLKIIKAPSSSKAVNWLLFSVYFYFPLQFYKCKNSGKRQHQSKKKYCSVFIQRAWDLRHLNRWPKILMVLPVKHPSKLSESYFHVKIIFWICF